MVGLNTQDTDAADRRFLNGMGRSSYPSVRDPDARKAADRVPERFLVDGRGYVRAKAVGAVTRQWLIDNAARLLAEDAPVP